MTDFSAVKRNLEARGFRVSTFETAQAAADYLNEAIDGVSVGFGGSITLEQLGLYERLASHNSAVWHWRTDDKLAARRQAMTTDMYITSVNGLAETGELINIDGTGNRISAATGAHERVYYLVGRNKLAETFDKALWRARNIASPLNARRLNRETPCVKNELKCYDCNSPQRICNGLSVVWKPLGGAQETHVLLIDEDLGY